MISLGGHFLPEATIVSEDGVTWEWRSPSLVSLIPSSFFKCHCIGLI